MRRYRQTFRFAETKAEAKAFCDAENRAGSEGLNVRTEKEYKIMEAAKISEKAINKAHCDWIIEQARKLKVLLSHDDPRMIELNRVRALSAIETSENALKELRAFIESV